MDSQGRLFVADRANNRIQIFDQEGKFLAEWKQFGRPSGIFIDKNDMLYVADSQSGPEENPGFKQGIRVGSAKDGKVTAFIEETQYLGSLEEHGRGWRRQRLCRLHRRAALRPLPEIGRFSDIIRTRKTGAFGPPLHFYRTKGRLGTHRTRSRTLSAAGDRMFSRLRLAFVWWLATNRLR